MQTRRSTRSSVLGKRPHACDHSPSERASSPALSLCSSSVGSNLPTPDPTPNPKRARTTFSDLDGDHNKENIPPFRGMVTPRRVSLRRTSSTATSLERSDSARPELRRASTSLLPATIGTLALTPPPTPIMPSTTLPLPTRARACLRATSNTGKALAGRASERAALLAFLTAPTDPLNNALYVSGSPGTGKTALIHGVLDEMATDAYVMFINCMALNSVDALWDRVLEDLYGGQKPSRGARKIKGREGVEHALQKLDTPCILILDEMDHIASTAAALSSLLTLRAPNLRILGIANTHTLSSALSPSTSSVQTLHFAPNTASELRAIIDARLQPIKDDEEMKKFLPEPSLKLLTMKTAAEGGGDVRALFEVLRGAIDKAVSAAGSASPAPAVTPPHILAALKAYSPGSSRRTTATSSETTTKVRNLGLNARLALSSIVLANTRASAGLSLSSNSSPSSTPTKSKIQLDVNSLYSYYNSLVSAGDILSSVGRSEFADVLALLETSGLIEMPPPSTSGSPTKRTFKRTPSSGKVPGSSSAGVHLVEGVRVEEVLRGLGIGSEVPAAAPPDAMEEEVRSIYQQENKKIGKLVRAAAAATRRRSGDVQTFAEAVEGN